ncbi:MAG TPA: creatininase family protein [Candidatus Krumholzibacteria bacterium]|nr:creatininase family protein [Candidatus Krumholzibacteria bacterium]
MPRTDPYAPLRVWDALEIGPVRLEPARLVAPYTVKRGGETETVELTYRYEEPVFTPDAPADANLAAMIAAQVALNYGLFARRLVFHGPYDAADRDLLQRMAENTAREITVKKFLEPNPFLIGDAAKLKPVPRENYLYAELVFPDAVDRAGTDAWDGGRGACAVLSSGGKDSLLSYGLLAELGVETHPVFINESGRHWFTALNSYRHFRDTVPRTARVWTDCDRVYTWILRRLPFIRPDFADVRADIYPVRLWSVAVFLFGALPLLRRRGVGRLLIGDEYDTTLRARTHDIPHYEGLYDQSRWFDLALSRYFHRKGWGVHQFSALRHCSELLIEKVLCERYPELLHQQVSCHAAHKGEDGRIVPCGRCEKCRRIVGMLTALGADPSTCGYDPADRERQIAALLREGVHQEDAGAEHMAHLLKGRGLWPANAPAPTPHPEVLDLRFDRDHAPLTTLPTDLRGPVLRLLLEHAGGAVFRTQRRWVPRSPFTHPDFGTPARYENAGPAPTPAPVAGDAPRRRPWLLGELTWPEAERRFRETDLVILPVGAVEQHGPHLPLDVDAFDAQWLSHRVAEGCSDPKPLVLPLLPFGVSYHHDDFPGTISLRNETMAQIIYDIGMSVARCGATKLVIVNGHGGNGPALAHAAQMINRDAHIFTCVESGETSDVDIDALAETPNDVHAGEIETSTTLALRPHLVDMDQARSEVPRFTSRFLDFTGNRAVAWNAYTSRISESGVMGDPTRADAAKGERMWDVMVRHLTEFVEELKGLSLDEIHQRRY